MAADRPATWAELRTTLSADLARGPSGFERLTLTVFRLGQYADAGR
jgi:hypothetical protein